MFDRALIRNPDTNDWSLLTGCVDVLVAGEHSEVLEVIEAAEHRAQVEQLHAVGYVLMRRAMPLITSFQARYRDPASLFCLVHG